MVVKEVMGRRGTTGRGQDVGPTARAPFKVDRIVVRITRIITGRIRQRKSQSVHNNGGKTP